MLLSNYTNHNIHAAVRPVNRIVSCNIKSLERKSKYHGNRQPVERG